MIKTYPEMNQEIAKILRWSEHPHEQYAAQYIDELQASNARLFSACQAADNFLDWSHAGHNLGRGLGSAQVLAYNHVKRLIAEALGD